MKNSRGGKTATLWVYAGVFMFIIALVAQGYKAPEHSSSESVANAASSQIVPTDPSDVSPPSVDQLVATQVAAGIAERAGMEIARNLSQVSVSLSVQSELAQVNNDVIVKPQIVKPKADTREIGSYTAVAGDTVGKVAAQYGLSVDTIKFANNLTSDALEAGRTIQIPPVNGLIYTVKENDTTASIAARYKANEGIITQFNEIDFEGLKVGSKLVIPDGNLPENERPGYVAPRPVQAYSSFSTGYAVGRYQGGSVGNRYAFGNCTYYAYDRRAELGRPIGSFWGDARSWAYAAAGNGYVVDRIPEVGAVAHWNAYADGTGYYGHVGIVESVNGDGTVTISEMNNAAYGGYNIVSRRTIPAGSVSNYIH